MNTLLINISKTQNEFLEKKAEECGCSEEEFIDILISRDMETDCRYIRFGSEGAECGLDGDCCELFSLDGIAGPEWLKGHECEKAIDYEGDISDLDNHR